MVDKTTKLIFIGALTLLVFLITSYAAFKPNLNIAGTANLTGSFSTKITNVVSKNIQGNASNNGDPTFNDTTATFKTNLISPGDSIDYDVTITNDGNLNAQLAKLTLTASDNPAIVFTTSGLTEGDIILAGHTAVLTVNVTYNNAITTQPDSTLSNLTITLDYIQAKQFFDSREILPCFF